MERDLTSILTRINLKLNSFAQDPDPNAFPSHPSYVSKSNASTPHLYSGLLQREQGSEKKLGRVSIQQVYMRTGVGVGTGGRRDVVNQEENGDRETENKNKMHGYQQFRASRSHEKLATTESSPKPPDPNPNAHEENYLSLRKRNQALENDVKKLQQRLKVLEAEFGRDEKESKIGREKGKARELVKVKSACNQSVRVQRRKGNADGSEKYLKKVSIVRTNFAVGKAGKPIGNEKPLPVKKIQTRLASGVSFGSSLHHLPIPQPSSNSTLKPAPKIPSCNSSKTLHRCKSSQALNLNQEGCQKKFGQDSAYSINSQSSYLRPVERSDLGLDKGKFFKRACKEGKEGKLNKTSHRMGKLY